MVRLSDGHLLQLISEALSEWNCDGFVVWKLRAQQWLDENIEGHSTKSIARLMHKFVDAGGKVDQVRERRSEHQDRYECHYDFRFPIDGRKVYIETVLDETQTGPTITVVNMHDE